MPPPASSQALSQAARRIQRELHDLPPSCQAGPTADNLYQWVAAVQGPVGSPYQSGIFFLDIKFPHDYPFKPPMVHFRTRIYHCNVNPLGEVNLDLLKDDWSPARTIAKVLSAICNLLMEPNPDDPLMAAIAHLYLTNRALHDEVASDWTHRFAT